MKLGGENMNEEMDKHHCDHCGKEEDVLLSTNKRRTLEGELYWVCGECFCELNSVTFEDYGTEKGVQ